MCLFRRIVPRDVTMTWTLTARGDALDGTMVRLIKDSAFPTDPTPVKGTRLGPAGDGR